MAETLMAETKPIAEGTAAPAESTLAKAPETKQSEQKPAAETPDKAAPAAKAEVSKTEETAKPVGAPEAYEFKAPKGLEFDATVLTAYSEVAKDLNLTQDAAQKVLDKVAPVLHQQQIQRVEEVRSTWAESAKVDREFGGDKLAESLATAKQALDKFGTPELRTLLEETGMGNHPELIRLLYRAGRAISEDRFVAPSGGDSKSAPQDFAGLAAKLYPSKPKA